MNHITPTKDIIKNARVVATFNGEQKHSPNPKVTKDPEFDRFLPAFIRTLKGETRGEMTEFLFYTPKTAQGADKSLILGGHAWDVHTRNSDYQFMQSFGAAFDHAVNEGLLDLLPENIKACENGPGSLSAVVAKTGHVIKRIAESGNHEVQSYLDMDKSSRYATEGAYWVQTECGVDKSYAMEGDFMHQTETIEHGRGNPVIMTWGGPFANAPIEHDGQTAVDNLTTYFMNMRSQHGLGSHFLIEIDLEDDIAALEKSYAVKPLSDQKKRAFSSFVLSAFHRAVHNGAILNKLYPVNKLWLAQTSVEVATAVIKDADGKDKVIDYPLVSLNAQAKKAHTVRTPNGDIDIQKNAKLRTQILSHKWPEEVWRHASAMAGAETKLFRHGNKGILWGKFTNRVTLPTPPIAA